MIQSAPFLGAWVRDLVLKLIRLHQLAVRADVPRGVLHYRRWLKGPSNKSSC